MPLNWEELERETMGTPYVPFTFPTITVQNNMERSAVKISTAEVDRMWEAYRDATINGGLMPYNSESGGVNLPIIQAMEKSTGYARLKIAAWLNALEKAVKEQGHGWRWLDPAGAAQAAKDQISPLNPLESIKTVTKSIGESAANLIRPSAEPVTNLVKWAAIAVVAGAVIYGGYQVSQIMKGRKRLRRGKDGG